MVRNRQRTLDGFCPDPRIVAQCAAYVAAGLDRDRCLRDVESFIKRKSRHGGKK